MPRSKRFLKDPPRPHSLTRRALAGALVAVSAMTASGIAQSQTPAPPTQPPASADREIDPAAIAALKRMGAYLVSLQSFEINATLSIEYVLDENQKILISGTSRYRVRRPDRLRIDLVTDNLERIFQYDGKQLVVTAPKEKFYARLDAKPTVRETLAWAAEKFGIEIPLADLFDWGAPDATADDIRDAFLVGKARIGGVECDHWAFREEGADWEIWIRSGGVPQPLRLTIVNTADAALPRYVADIAWTERATFEDDLFVKPPVPDAKQIEYIPLAPQPQRR